MKYIPMIITGLIAALALLSGVSKVMLAPQETEFYYRFGMVGPLLIAFGGLQIIGGALMLVPRVRVYGLILVAVTFIASLVLLLIDMQWGIAAVTAVVLLFLAYLIVASRRRQIQESNIVEESAQGSLDND